MTILNCRRLKFAALGVCLLFSACATFEPALRTSDLMRARQPTVMEAQEGLEVSIEEFASVNKAKQAFDADVASYGVLALLLRIENNGSQTYKIPVRSIAASLDGQSLSLLGGEEAANQAATSEYAGKALGWTVATGPFFILLWPATIAGSAAHTQSVNRRIQQHFENLQFNDAQLKPNQSAAGFLYFKLPRSVNKQDKVIVEIKPTEDAGGKQLAYRLSLQIPADFNLGGKSSAPDSTSPDKKMPFDTRRRSRSS